MSLFVVCLYLYDVLEFKCTGECLELYGSVFVVCFLFVCFWWPRWNKMYLLSTFLCLNLFFCLHYIWFASTHLDVLFTLLYGLVES